MSRILASQAAYLIDKKEGRTYEQLRNEARERGIKGRSLAAPLTAET
jgi:hypothetical protein